MMPAYAMVILPRNVVLGMGGFKPAQQIIIISVRAGQYARAGRLTLQPPPRPPPQALPPARCLRDPDVLLPYE